MEAVLSAPRGASLSCHSVVRTRKRHPPSSLNSFSNLNGLPLRVRLFPSALSPSRTHIPATLQRPSIGVRCSAASDLAGPEGRSGHDEIVIRVGKVVLYAAAAVALAAAVQSTAGAGLSAGLPFLHMSSTFVGGHGSPATGAPLRALQVGWAGLAAGCLHTLTGPDHLAALAPLTIGRSRAASLLLGALWGGGHGTGQMLLGLVFLLFKDQLSSFMPMLSRWSGTLVGIVLILIGAHGIKEAQELAASGLATEPSIESDTTGILESGRTLGLATYCNGVVFGLQPDALMVVLPALALPTKAAAAVYCITFLIGTMVAMGSYTACIGAASRAVGKRMPWITQRLSLIAGVVALLLGGVFVAQNTFQIGV